MSTQTTNTQMSCVQPCVDQQRDPVRVDTPERAPNRAESAPVSVDDAVELKCIVITLKNQKITMTFLDDGQWNIQEDNLTKDTKAKAVTKHKRPKLNAAARRLYKRQQLYKEMSRKKRRFEGTAFGRLRKRHKHELTRNAFRRVALKADGFKSRPRVIYKETQVE